VRDANYFGAPQWTCLSEALVAAGIAAPRYDDPGDGESTGDFYDLSYADRDFDVAATGVVAAHADVDGGFVFLLGHSEGGDHASRAPIATPAVTGLILVAGVATPLADAVVGQRAVLHGNSFEGPPQRPAEGGPPTAGGWDVSGVSAREAVEQAHAEGRRRVCRTGGAIRSRCIGDDAVSAARTRSGGADGGAAEWAAWRYRRSGWSDSVPGDPAI